MSPSLAEAPKQKKFKTIEDDSQSVEHLNNSGGWTKVEKRKQKKFKRAEAKMDVGISSFSCLSPISIVVGIVNALL
jgi:uncharacterized protein YjaZ